MSPRSEAWLSYGDRVWTLPEALLSKNLYFKSGTRTPEELSLRNLANWAYRDNLEEMALIDAYEKDFLPIPEKIELLHEAIWKRKSGSESKTFSAVDQRAVLLWQVHRLLCLRRKSML